MLKIVERHGTTLDWIQKALIRGNYITRQMRSPRIRAAQSTVPDAIIFTHRDDVNGEILVTVQVESMSG